jgi:hypothetical protein
LSVTATKKAAQNPESGNTTTGSEQVRFIVEIDMWEDKSFDLRDDEEIKFKENVNNWLTEMELIWRSSMIGINTLAGFGGFVIARKFSRKLATFADYQEAYRNQVLLLSQKDLTEARLLRNALATNWQNQSLVDEFYSEWDEFIKRNSGRMTLRNMKTEFKKKAIFHETVNFRDRSGRMWNPDRYAEMWSRTRSREIEDIINTSEMSELGFDVIQINNVSTITPICLNFEGKYFSLTGATPGLPIYETKAPFHPNCKHRKLAVNESRVSTGEMVKVNSSIPSASVRYTNRTGKKITTGQKKSTAKQLEWNEQNRRI